MPDVTGWDPAVVAQIWIYIVAAFVIGVVLGFLLHKVWFKREIDNHKERLQKLSQIEQDYLKLQNDIKESKEYWIYMQQKDCDNSDFLENAAEKLKR